MSTGTFGGKNNLDLKLKETKSRDVQSAAIKRARRPISGISGISSRDCPITDDTHTSNDFGTVNDRDSDEDDDLEKV